MHPINYVAITYASAALKGSDIQINAKGKLDRTLDPETLRCGFEGHILNTYWFTNPLVLHADYI